MTTSEQPSPDAMPEEPLSADAVLAETPAADEEQREDGTPPERLPALLEALLFVADGPVTPATLGKVFGLTRRQIEGPLEELSESLQERGLRLQHGPDGVQLVTAPFASSFVEAFLGLESAKRLSTAALETLAIIAYRQPVTRAQVEAIRGVNSDGAIDTLRSRGLVDITGRAETAGRPALFATTQRFLEHFGLQRAEDLPPLPEEVAGVAAARFMEFGSQLPLPPVEVAEARSEPRPEAPHMFPGEHDRPAPAEPDAPRPTPGPHLPGSAALPGSGPAGSPGGLGGPSRPTGPQVGGTTGGNTPGGMRSGGFGPAPGQNRPGLPPRGPGLPPGSSGGAPRLG